LFIVATVSLKAGDGFAAQIGVAEGEKCPRCWNIRELGVDAVHPEVCGRCATVLGATG
jgi:isoleucyl-tRNA synthetase